MIKEKTQYMQARMKTDENIKFILMTFMHKSTFIFVKVFT